MAADRVQTDAGGEFDRSIVEPHPPGEVQPHDPDDILDFERARKEGVPHVTPGRVVQLDFLQMKLRHQESGGTSRHGRNAYESGSRRRRYCGRALPAPAPPPDSAGAAVRV